MMEVAQNMAIVLLFILLMLTRRRLNRVRALVENAAMLVFELVNRGKK